MSDELEKTSPRKRKKEIEVEVVLHEKKTALVRYMDGENVRKVVVPRSKIKDGKVEESVLGEAIPYGLPWEEVEFPEITGADIAHELHKRDVWTSLDFQTKPNQVRAAINQLYGKPLAVLSRFVAGKKKKNS